MALAVALLALLPASALAQAPWQWQMSLRVETRGDALYMPSAVGFDPVAERYYAVDTGRNRLVSFDREGKLLRAFTADDRLKAPFDMVRLDDGRLWVVEKGRNSVTRIDIPAREVTPHVLKDAGRTVFPDRIADAGGALYVLDRSIAQVLRLADDLTVEQRYVCTDCVGGFTDFAVHDGEVWALEMRGKNVVRFGPDGTILQRIDLGEELDIPVSLALGEGDFLYVLDRHRNQIAAYGLDGRFRYRFLGPGHGRGQLHFPRQIRFDPWGRLCVVDEGNGRIEIFAR
jgi:sugar lactone lactonase YvrE